MPLFDATPPPETPKHRASRKRPIVSDGEFDGEDDRFDYPVTRWFAACDYPLETLKRVIISLKPTEQRELLEWVEQKNKTTGQ